MNPNTQRFVKEHMKLMKKHHVTLGIRLEVPGKEKLPLLARLAVWMLGRMNVAIKTTVVPVK